MAIRAWMQEESETGREPRDPRRRVLLEGVEASASGAAIAVTIHNISASGMLLECSESLDVGESLRVDLPDRPDSEAAVVWVSGRLLGCQFDQPLGRSTLSAALLRSAVREEGVVLLPKPAESGEPLGPRLRRLRKAQGLTLADLAAELGVSKPTVWAWEQGRSAPAQERHEKIAQVLGTSAATLRTGRDGHAAAAVLERSRQQIAEAFGVEIDKIRIMIEL